MLMLTGWIAGKFDVGFHVDGFWPAFWGALIITLVTGFINVAILRDDD
ncbi:MAG: phage holin family protein [Nocardioides sp.]